MKHFTLLMLFLLVIALLALAAWRGGPAAAQGGQQAFAIHWWTVDGGGGAASTGGGYTLGGTAGQPDAGAMADSTYTLRGGFWVGGGPAAAGYGVYLPVVFK
jgi:hypothetical protein